VKERERERERDLVVVGLSKIKYSNKIKKSRRSEGGGR
jgi:hypothetical protein